MRKWRLTGSESEMVWTRTSGRDGTAKAFPRPQHASEPQEGPVRLTFVPDAETGIWQAEGAIAGPAGVAQLDLPIGVLLTVDRALPEVIVAIDLDPADTSDELLSALAEFGIVSEAALALSSAPEVADHPIEVEIDVAGPVRRGIARRALLGNDLDELSIEEPSGVLAAAQFELALTSLQLPESFGLRTEAAVALGAALTLWDTEVLDALQDHAMPRMVEMLEHLAVAAQLQLGGYLELQREIVAVSADATQRLAAIQPPMPQLTRPEAEHHAVALSTLSDEELADDLRHRLDAMLGPSDPMAQFSSIGSHEITPISSATHDFHGVVALERPEPDRISVRSLPFIESPEPADVWVHVYEWGTLVAARPLGHEGEELTFEVERTAPIDVRLALSPAHRRPGRVDASTALARALAAATVALDADRIRDFKLAASQWFESAIWWLSLDDGSRAATALRAGAEAAHNGAEHAYDQLLEVASALAPTPTRTAPSRLWVPVWREVALELSRVDHDDE